MPAFTSATVPAPAGKSHTPGARRYKDTALAQARELQRIAYELAIQLARELEAEIGKPGVRIRLKYISALGSLIRTWVLITDRIRILRGIGLPARIPSREPVNRRSGRRARVMWAA